MEKPAMIRLLKAFLVLPVLFATSAATAQEPDPHGWVAEVQERLAEAWTGGDAEAISALFVEDAIYWPLAGGTLEGAGEIRRQFEQEFARQMVPTSVEITSSRTERLNGMVFDVGTFTATMPQDTGGETRGEYVVLAEDADEGVMIRRLMAFPTRRVPEGRRSARRSLSPATGDTHTPLGEGNASCGAWVEARQNAGSDETTYSAWLSGYVTAFGRWRPKDYDATAVADLAGIRVWLDQFCRQNPLQAISEAAEALVLELRKQRALSA
jgi:uncharacterized protein (TIGR02246 family)